MKGLSDLPMCLFTFRGVKSASMSFAHSITELQLFVQSQNDDDATSASAAREISTDGCDGESERAEKGEEKEGDGLLARSDTQGFACEVGS